MSSEHIRFITVGFADLIANLPDDDDPDVIWSEPELADYWPDTPWSSDDALENVDDHYTYSTPIPYSPDDDEQTEDPDD